MRVPAFLKGETLPTLRWAESPNFSERSAAIANIVLHDTEGGYSGAVSWFGQTQSQVSAHFVVREDGLEVTQMVPTSKKAWHVAAYNSQSIGIEMAGFAAKGFSAEELRRAARLVAYLAGAYRVPAKLAVPDAAGHLPAGITFHQLLGQLGGGHHDPGFTPAEITAFIALVQAEAARGGFRRSYERR